MTDPASHTFPLSITCPADLAVLNDLRVRVIEAAEQCGFRGEDAVKIEMAVDEACSNVARHAYTAGDRSALMPVKSKRPEPHDPRQRPRAARPRIDGVRRSAIIAAPTGPVSAAWGCSS